MKQADEDKLRAQQMIKEHEKKLDEQAKKRAKEWQDREDKIKNAMSRMADTVVKKGNAAEREMEKRLMQQQLEKEQRDQDKEKQKKDQAF